MKALLTLLISLSSLSAFAQHFMLGVHGGALFNTAPNGSAAYFDNFENKPQMLLGAKLGIDTRKIQFGIGCNVSSITHTRSLKMSGSPSDLDIFSYEYSASFANPYLFLNLKKNLARSFLYIGASAGYMKFMSGRDEVHYQGVFFHEAYQDANAFSGGLQAGGRVKLIDGLGISAEAGMRYTTKTPAMMIHDVLGNDVGFISGGMFSFPVSLGVDYIF